MLYELKLQCTSHSRAKTVLWEAQPAINKDKALPGLGLGRVIADSIISLSPPPSGPQITWALGHCPLDSAQRQREMAKQFISSETECKLGLVKCLGPESNDRALILKPLRSLITSTQGSSLYYIRRGPSSGGVSAPTPSLSGRTHTRTPSPQPHSGGCPSSQIRSLRPCDGHVCTCARRANEHPPWELCFHPAKRTSLSRLVTGWKNRSLAFLQTIFLLHGESPPTVKIPCMILQ